MAVKFFKDPSGLKIWIEKVGDFFWVHTKNQTFRFKKLSSNIQEKINLKDKDSLEIRAPHPGRVSQILVKAKDHVKKGQTLIILESMKMEHALQALGNGQIEQIHVKEKQSVDDQEKLLTFFGK